MQRQYFKAMSLNEITQDMSVKKKQNRKEQNTLRIQTWKTTMLRDLGDEKDDTKGIKKKQPRELIENEEWST